MKIINIFSKLLTIIYIIGIMITISLNFLSYEQLLELTGVDLTSQFSGILFITATTLAAGYFFSLFILSFYANFRSKTDNFQYLLWMKVCTGIIFVLSGLFGANTLILFGLVDLALGGLYYMQYKNN